MRLILLLICQIFIFPSIHSQTLKSEFYGLKGNVKRVEESSFIVEYAGDSLIYKNHIRDNDSFKEFDEQGRLTSKGVFDLFDGKYDVLEYNTKTITNIQERDTSIRMIMMQNPIRQLYLQTSVRNNNKSTITFIDSLITFIETFEYTKESIIYKFDEYDNLIELKIIDEEGAVLHEQWMQFDKLRNQIESKRAFNRTCQ